MFGSMSLRQQVDDLRQEVRALKSDVTRINAALPDSERKERNLRGRVSTLEKVLAADGFRPGDIVESEEEYYDESSGSERTVGRVLIHHQVEDASPFCPVRYEATVLDGPGAGARVHVPGEGKLLSRRTPEERELWSPPSSS